jgi:signal transduction histidine kinase
MDNMDGRISYLGRLNYPLLTDSLGVTVFIDLKSKIQSEGIGFPELLIDNSMRRPASYKRFDYAKYFGGELVNRHGDFPYNFYIYSYDFTDSEFSYNIWDGYEHLIHKTRENNYVIVSRSLYNFVDYLISFPYLFVVFFLCSLAALLFIRPNLVRQKMLFDLKFRIQAAIISIVFISLLLVAISTIFYNLKESKSRLQADLDQKMNSISEELDLRLENETSVSPVMIEWLITELVKLSNIFQTDINIYGVNGNLLVSSRPEIFNRGLVSRKINTQAYYELYENFQTNYFQPEKIGSLSYLSAYEPIINNRGEYLGFINLPYFTHQDKYSQEISTFVVAFINLYVLLFLVSILIAVFFANQITLPLFTIRENLRKIELGKRNEPINYHRDDEIGKLVREYNKKVDELAVSADLLARSERESAWREMAKQVAHEIKNPLTPMKLNIQHLQRFRGEGEQYHDYVNRICQTLINQIDTLSDIATEFSNFAQIPTAMRQIFNLSEQIGKVIELYEPDEHIRISFDKRDCGYIRINADREQLSRALINLIRNGIQAIPENRPGKILISLNREEQLVIIRVSDNGTGISPELQEKMFSPNFTTKSSGMGLGLAIVKNIAGNFSGKVWYETRLNEGTTFCFGIPVYDETTES